MALYSIIFLFTLQYYFLNFDLSSSDLSTMCRFHVIPLARIVPRYLTESLFGIGILFMVTCGQDCFRSVKII